MEARGLERTGGNGCKSKGGKRRLAAAKEAADHLTKQKAVEVEQEIAAMRDAAWERKRSDPGGNAGSRLKKAEQVKEGCGYGSIADATNKYLRAEKDRKAILEKIEALGIMEMNQIADVDDGFEKMDYGSQSKL